MKSVITITLFFSLFILLFMPVSSVKSGINPFNFGGWASKIVPCPANAGLWVTVVGPSGGLYMYQLGFSGIKQFGPPRTPGQRVLGKSSGVMVCLVPCPIGVCPIGAGLLVMPNAGSSALPSPIP